MGLKTVKTPTTFTGNNNIKYELNSDILIMNEYENINNIIKQFPVFKTLENKYKEIFEENILLKLPWNGMTKLKV